MAELSNKGRESLPPKTVVPPARPSVETPRPSPFTSPLITLCVGPESAKQVQYYVHQDKLLHIPFFKAALRPDAFIEGAEKKINFEEETPPFCESYVQRILPESKKEKYKSEWHDMGLACGTFTSTAGTHEAFKTAVLVLCLGERYGMQDLVDLCVEKLSCLPIGTKEVSTLAKYVLKEVPESNHVVYGFLQENISLFRPRLPQCEAFQELQKSSDLLLLQGLLRLTTPNEPPTFELEDPTYWGGPQWPFRFAICKSKVTLGDPIANFGSDTPPNANPTPSRFTPERTLYGAALKGEILVTFGKCDKRGIFLGGNPLINDGCFHNWLAYPTSCFELLNGLS